MTITDKIKELQSQLTGDLMNDCGTHNEIYKLKLQLNPEIETNPELDDDDYECLNCGS